jgi:hypothetical protein
MLATRPGAFFLGDWSIRAGVVGGSNRNAPVVGSSTGETTETGDPVWAFAAPPAEKTIPLTEDGADVVLRISLEAAPGCYLTFGNCPPVPALLIDDVRVE